MQAEDVLEQLGLGKHEAALYSLLLRRGESTAVEISKISGLHRRTVYDTMEALQREGLVGIKLKRHVKHFVAEDPATLKRILDEKQQLLDRILPSLLKRHRAHDAAVNILIYEGAEGMKVVFRKIIDGLGGGEIVMIGAGLKAPAHFRYTFPQYLTALKRMKWRLIQPDVKWIRDELDSWDVPRNYRFLPEKYLSPLSLVVYGKTTVIVLMEPVPLLIEIAGEQYANAFRNYFEILWAASEA